MGVIPERKEYKNCPKELFAAYVDALEKGDVCRRVAFTPAGEKSQFDAYGFVRDNRKISVVYDNKARILSLTAHDDVMPALAALFTGVKARLAQPAPAPQPKQPQAKPQPEQPKQQQPKTQVKTQPPKQAAQQPKQSAQKPQPQTKQAAQQPQKTQPAQPATPKQVVQPATAKTKKPAAEKRGARSAAADSAAGFNAPKAFGEAGADGNFSVKKFTPERFDAVLKKLKKDKKKYKLTGEQVFDEGKTTELRSFTVAGEGQKLRLAYMAKKQVVQLQGKRSALFDDIRLMLSEETDFAAAVDAHVELAGESHKRAAELERQLKKLIPSAFPFLTKQSKTELTIGVIEILNTSAKHYDYSMLLLSPFRGLECLIFDLQRAENIVVRMIGQAYERDGGEYVLKASYRKRIGSIVYAEVMAALYRFYSAQRNYYAHSDNSEGGEGRRITDRAQAREIFERLLAVIEYNCKKLTEIGFSIG